MCLTEAELLRHLKGLAWVYILQSEDGSMYVGVAVSP